MSTPAPCKTCPRCGTVAGLTAPTCAQCGRVYRTQFAPPAATTPAPPTPPRAPSAAPTLLARIPARYRLPGALLVAFVAGALLTPHLWQLTHPGETEHTVTIRTVAGPPVYVNGKRDMTPAKSGEIVIDPGAATDPNAPGNEEPAAEAWREVRRSDLWEPDNLPCKHPIARVWRTDPAYYRVMCAQGHFYYHTDSDAWIRSKQQRVLGP